MYQTPLSRSLGRFFEIVTTDLLVRDSSKPVRPRRARVEVEVHRLQGEPWRELVPADRHSRVRAFLRRGDTGWVARVDGRFAGWVWLSTVSHRDPYSGLRIRLAGDEGYAYALWVEPEHRPQGVAAVLMSTLLAAVGDDEALTRVYGWVDRRNRESQVLLRLLGFEPAQQVRRVHVLHRFGRQVPRSARPPFGPLSSSGRHAA